jgi:four helix bundle protein
MEYSFENQEVWHMSRALVKDIYLVTSTFPQEEKLGLTNQLRRASISVSSNIAEESIRWSKIDHTKFYEIAFVRLIEILNQLILSADLGFLSEAWLKKLKAKISRIGSLLTELYHSTQKPINPSTN